MYFFVEDSRGAQLAPLMGKIREAGARGNC